MREIIEKMDNEIINKVKDFVESECKKPTSHYGDEVYFCHFIPMVSYAKNLMRNYEDVDEVVVELAAWLHDIGSVIKGRKDHHITGAEIAGQKLQEFGLKDNLIEKVQYCIYSHRGSQNIERKSNEAQIIADADTLSAFDNISGLFKAAIYHENLDQIAAKASVKRKLINSWNKLSPKAKEIIRIKYEAAMILLG